jgi:hypothetical protein
VSPNTCPIVLVTSAPGMFSVVVTIIDRDWLMLSTDAIGGTPSLTSCMMAY